MKIMSFYKLRGLNTGSIQFDKWPEVPDKNF